ncbi:molecular chaperone DnaJ [endosymbiont of Pachyrhynchus infernalis]|uniref:molecular chaperone DnaJ n=1 Tax=endosymbiont of Pachyrhynchus infernalis TaxID=1971488 RepID=UPI000DC73460|nr:molecular chaperone DnaJ [endosymbiont of Pachyrhynchus infernalis]BBA84818.1 chaperone protein DnaJ [endosymbiont of Pachyrhynchus infernalis]
MNKLDYYKILGLSRDANDRDIKRAYKKLAMKFHPDHNPNNSSSEEKFKEIKEAYEVLINPSKRSAYDKYGHSAFNQDLGGNEGASNRDSNFSSNFSDIFSDIFGDIFSNGSKQKYNKGQDLHYNLEIDFEESIKGCNKDIKILFSDKCDNCENLESKGNYYTKCPACNGYGNIQIRQGFFLIQQTCTKCNGNKKIVKNICNVCSGKSYIKKSKILSIKIPSGINNEDKIKINQKGEINKDSYIRGDLYICVKVKSSNLFVRKDNDLYCEIPINFSVAALGGEIEIPYINGKLKLKIPSETQSGKVFRIKEKGIKRNNVIGDLLCKIIVETPVKLNNNQKKLLYELENTFKSSNININNPQFKNFIDNINIFLEKINKLK